MTLDNTVPTESVPIKREKKEAVFATPIYAKQLFTDEGSKNFDALPSWQRHLVKRIIDHGDIEKAAEEAGVSTFVKKTVDLEGAEKKTIIEALNKGGLDNTTIVDHLRECLEANTIRFDKHQNAIPCKDLNLTLKTIEVICRLKGLFDGKKIEKKEDVIDLFKDTKA